MKHIDSFKYFKISENWNNGKGKYKKADKLLKLYVCIYI